MGDELEQNEDDAYPEDGPLKLGAHSLRRIPNSRSPMVKNKTQLSIFCLCLLFSKTTLLVLSVVYQRFRSVVDVD